MTDKAKEIIHHIEWFGLMATIIGGFFIMTSTMHDMESKLDQRIQAETMRTDKLYEMFIDLLKERK